MFQLPIRPFSIGWREHTGSPCYGLGAVNFPALTRPRAPCSQLPGTLSELSSGPYRDLAQRSLCEEGPNPHLHPAWKQDTVEDESKAGGRTENYLFSSQTFYHIPDSGHSHTLLCSHCPEGPPSPLTWKIEGNP